MVDFRINVIVDPSRVPQGTKKVTRELQKLERSAGRVQRSFVRMLAPLAAGAAILGAVRSMAQFEEAMATVKGVTNATAEEFEKLQNRALDLGRTTRFSAKQAADALVNLSRAGFTVSESIESVDDTLALAQAAGLQLAEAADITATAMRGFGLAASDATMITDVLVTTSNKANTTVSELGQGLKFVAPIAAALGKGIGETSAALGILSDSGLKATLAGTGLRRVLGELASPNAKLAKLIKDAGESMADINPETNELVDIMELLGRAGISAGEALEIFGQRGAPAVLSLVKHSGRLRDLNKAIDDGAGSTKRVAETLDKTLNGAIFRAKSAMDGLVQTFGQAGASDAFVNALDSLAAILRFLGDNIDVITTAFIAFIAVVGIKMVGTLTGAALPALRALSLSLALSGGAANVATTAMLRLNAALLANPFILVGTAIGFVIYRLKQMNDDAIIAGKTLDMSMQDSVDSINSNGQALSSTQRELNKYLRRVEAGEKLSQSQIARVNELGLRYSEVTAKMKRVAREQREINEARKSALPSVENLLAKLAQEAALLSTLSREKANIAAADKRIDDLRKAGVAPSQAQQTLIKNAVARNESLKIQKKLLEDIRGPQEAFKTNSEALAALLKRGAINSNEYNSSLVKLKESLSDVDSAGGGNALDRLRQETDLLKIKLELGEQAAAAVALENALRAEGEDITPLRLIQIQLEIAASRLVNIELKEKSKLLKDEASLAKKAAQQEIREMTRLEQRINGTKALADEKRRLILLEETGRIGVEELAIALAKLEIKALASSTALGDGFKRAFLKLKIEANDLAAIGEKIVNTFANTATDALVKFAETGKFSFREFASSIVKDILRITARLLILKAIEAGINAFGGGAATATTGVEKGISPGALQSVSGARANGGPVQANRSYLVGEEGPEILNTNRSGTIIPNGGGTGGAAPVNVQVVNVDDPRKIPEAINDGSSDDAIINVLTRKKSAIQRLLQ